MSDINELGVLNINAELMKQQELQMNMDDHQQEEQSKQQIAPEMTREQKKEALKKGRALADKMKDSYVIKRGEYAKLSAPMTSELRSEYREEFRDKSLMKSRESKIKNKKSRLYKKNEAANRIEAMEAGEFQMRDMRAKLRRSIPEEERLKLTCVETKDLSVLSSLLSQDDQTMESKFRDLVDRYSGFKQVEGEEKKKVEMSPEEKEAARFDVMAEVANELMANSKLDSINLYDDDSLSQNAPLLERLSSMTAIFNRMLQANPGFMKTLNQELTTKKTINDAQGNVIKVQEKKVMAGGITGDMLTKQLERLQAVSDVYRVRKLIVTNQYYRTHYNEELSMNASENASPEQKYLSKLLRTSFYLGKNLQKLGSSDVDVNDASQKLHAEGKYSENVENKICRISSDDSDFDNTAEVQKAAKTLHGSKYDKKVNEIKKKLKKERRANTESLLVELEHERFTMPEEDMKFDLKTVGKKKVNKKGFILSNPTVTHNLYLARRDKNPREDEADKKSLKSRVREITTKDNVYEKSIGLNSSRLGNHIGGDAIARQMDNFTGQFVENMTDEEVLEMVEGLTYSIRKEEKDRTPEQQKMAEDMYLSSYLTYTNHVHQAMKKTMNIVGDNLATLHAEDWARLMSNPRFANLIGLQGAISSNMELHLPYEFLKKYSGQNVEHLKDFYMLSKAASAIQFIADGLRASLSDIYKDTREGECTNIKEEASKKLKDVKSQIEKNIKAGVPEDSPEMRKLREQATEYHAQTDSPQMIVLEKELPDIEEYRKKQFTVEVGDEEVEDNIYEVRKEFFSVNLGLCGYREQELLKNSSYWEYGKTSEKEKQDYKKSLKSKGLSECYDMDIVKKEVLNHSDDVLKGLSQIVMEAKKLGVDTDLVEENMQALAKTLTSMGYSKEELSGSLSSMHKRSEETVEINKKQLTGDKEKDKKAIENIEMLTERIRLIEDMGKRLKVEIKKGAA